MGKVMMSQLASVLMEKHGLDKRTAQRFLSAVVEVIQYGITTDRLVKIKGLGTYKVIEVGARESVNVNTGERVVIDGHSKLTFTPDSAMKDLVNKPFSQFETVILNDGVEFDDMPQDEEINTQEGDTPAAVEYSEPEQAPQTSEFLAGAVDSDDVAPISEKDALQDDVSSETEDKAIERLEADQNMAEGNGENADSGSMEEQKDEISSEDEAPAADSDTEALEDTADVAQPENDEEEGEAAAALAAMPEQNTEHMADRRQTDNRRSFPWLWVLACLLSGIFGYLLGRSAVGGFGEDTTQTAIAAKETADTTDVADRHDTVNVVTGAEELAAGNSVQMTSTDVQPDSDEYKKYEAMDARVRLGAYRIIGVQEIAKARAGESVKQISHRYLGPDMECYVEVLNGLKATDVLKAGQNVKIPKLEWKKNLRKNRK